MAIKVSKTQYGYRYLLVYKKAEELQAVCSKLTEKFPHTKTLIALADQMNRSARSVKQNIVEGWKRNLTYEYYQFLGYAIASNAELEEDCNDIIKGIYPELKGTKGVNGIKGTEDVEKLPFYPLDSHLPLLIQLKLRAKELNFLLDRLQQSLINKMAKEGVLSERDKLRRAEEKKIEYEKWYGEFLEKQGLMRLENGRVVKRDEGEKRDKGDS